MTVQIWSKNCERFCLDSLGQGAYYGFQSPFNFGAKMRVLLLASLGQLPRRLLWLSKFSTKIQQKSKFLSRSALDRLAGFISVKRQNLTKHYFQNRGQKPIKIWIPPPPTFGRNLRPCLRGEWWPGVDPPTLAEATMNVQSAFSSPIDTSMVKHVAAVLGGFDKQQVPFYVMLAG